LTKWEGPTTRLGPLTPLAQPFFEFFARDDSMDQDHSVRIEDLIEDSKISNPKSQEIIVRALNRIY
jgi:hypothetical protein